MNKITPNKAVKFIFDTVTVCFSETIQAYIDNVFNSPALDQSNKVELFAIPF